MSSVLFDRLKFERYKVDEFENKIELLNERIHMLSEDNKNVLKSAEKWKDKAVAMMTMVHMMIPNNSGHADCKCPTCLLHKEVKRIMEE